MEGALIIKAALSTVSLRSWQKAAEDASAGLTLADIHVRWSKLIWTG
jgi:hypothetical protein